MRVHLRTGLVVLLTVALLALFLRNASLAAVWAEIREARPGLVVLGLLATLVTYVLRAYRWQFLLDPIGGASFGPAFRTTVIGFGASAVLPGRAGEVLRPYLLARWEGLSASAAFATILLERLLDLVAVLVLFAAFLILFDPGLANVDPVVFQAMRVGGLAAAGVAVAALVTVYFLAGHPERVGGMAQRTERFLPRRIATALAGVLTSFAEGLGAMRQPRGLLLALVLSFPLWGSIAAGIWLLAAAFSITFPFTGSFLMVALLVVGVSVPTPGAVGGFHEAFRLGATAFYGAPNDRAIGAAIVLHAISVVPVTLAGIAFMFQAGLNFGSLRRMAERKDVAIATAAEAKRRGPRPPRLTGAPVDEPEGTA